MERKQSPTPFGALFLLACTFLAATVMQSFNSALERCGDLPLFIAMFGVIVNVSLCVVMGVGFFGFLYNCYLMAQNAISEFGNR